MVSNYVLTDSAIDNGAGLTTSTDNSGSVLDFSAGAGVVQAPTGNSLLDSLGSLSNVVTKGLSSYGSFLEKTAVANAANRLGTTPVGVAGQLPTVPLSATTAANQELMRVMLYIGVAAIGVAGILMIMKKA